MKEILSISNDISIHECFSYQCLLEYKRRKAEWSVVKDQADFNSLQHKGYRFLIVQTAEYDVNQPYLVIIKSLLDIYCFVNNRNRGVKQVNRKMYVKVLKELNLLKII